MPEQRVFVIAGMSPREVQPRDGRPSFTVYEIFDDQGNTWRARDDLYRRAQGWFGQRVVATTRTEQRGNFTNLYVDQMEPATQMLGSPAQVAQQSQPQQPQPQAHGPAVVTGPIVSEWEKQKQASIHRQTAGKVAAKMSTTPDEFWENVVAVCRYFDTGQVPHQISYTAAAPTQQQRQNAAAYQPYEHTDPGPQTDQYATQADDSVPF